MTIGEDLILLTVIKLQLANTWRSVRPSKDVPSHSINDPLQKQLDDVAGTTVVTTLSPDSSCLSHELSVNLLSSVKRTGDLSVLVFSGECQSSYTMLVCEHRSH